ncbi:hypothetical protein CIG19_00590 [Enterobacterales bacterium CwR94]|nr:hypothetical protein CIG19_00590 [Enterobacterales bacterium CwR94]
MVHFPIGSIVKHRSGDIKGTVLNVLASSTAATGYFVRWDDGTHSYHQHAELEWGNIDRLTSGYTHPSVK